MSKELSKEELLIQNKKLISMLGCLVESVTADVEPSSMSEQLATDLKESNVLLDSIEV